MFQYPGFAWTVWKIGARRFGPVGATVFALLAIVGVVLLRDYLRENYPGVGRKLDAAL
jgi:hypothetical protein